MEHVSIKAKEQVSAAMMQQLQGQQPSQEQMMQAEGQVAQLIAEGMQQVKQLSSQISGQDQADPLIALKEQDLQIRAQRDAAENQMDQQRLQLDQQKAAMTAELGQDRIQSAEDIAEARIQAAREREIMKQQQQG